MNRKDQKLIWEAYLSGQEASKPNWESSQDDMTPPPGVFERALADPTNYVLYISTGEGLWDEPMNASVYTVYEIGDDGKYGDYEIVYSYDDIQDIVDAFETKNPGGIKDER